MTTDGKKIQDKSGDVLVEWFALELQSQLALSDSDVEGDYQVAIFSDDGSVMTLNPGTKDATVLVDNDNEHPTRMGCSTTTIHMTKGKLLPFKLDYYQGPRFEIALLMMWRPVKAGTPQDSLCGVTGNDAFWNPTNSAPEPHYQTLVHNGWTIPNANNFVLQAGQRNPCSDPMPGGPGSCH